LLTAEILRQGWRVIVWLVGPWACGCSLVLGIKLVRAFTYAKSSDGNLDLMLRRSYIVVNRAHGIGAAVVAFALALILAIMLSRRAVRI